MRQAKKESQDVFTILLAAATPTTEQVVGTKAIYDAVRIYSLEPGPKTQRLPIKSYSKRPNLGQAALARRCDSASRNAPKGRFVFSTCCRGRSRVLITLQQRMRSRQCLGGDVKDLVYSG